MEAGIGVALQKAGLVRGGAFVAPPVAHGLGLSQVEHEVGSVVGRFHFQEIVFQHWNRQSQALAASCRGDVFGDVFAPKAVSAASLCGGRVQLDRQRVGVNVDDGLLDFELEISASIDVAREPIWKFNVGLNMHFVDS